MLLTASGVLKPEELVRGWLAGALPLHAASPRYARYRPGMTYGDHLDDPIMGSGGLMYRSDVALTLFRPGVIRMWSDL